MANSLDRGMLPDERDRLTRLETKVDYIIDHMESLPASPETIRRLEDVVAAAEEANKVLLEHDKFITTLKERMAWIGASFAVLGSAASYGISWVLSHINVGWGN